MWKVIQSLIRKDSDLPDRSYPLMLYKRILDGNIYECFKYSYGQEYIGSLTYPEYVEEAKRAPCINSGLNIMRSVVEQSVGFVWGEDRFPRIMIDDDNTKAWVDNIVKDTHLSQVMQDATTVGSIGSSLIHVKVLNDRFFLDVHDTIYFTPAYDPQAPDTLISLTEKKKVLGRDLIDAGYKISDADKDTEYWFQRVWDTQDEVWYHPWKCNDKDARASVDNTRTTRHGLGLVPWVWMKNLDSCNGQIDGRCTFEPAIENCIQIDYAMSRADRALKYNSDPLMIFKTRNPNQVADFARNSGNAMILPIESDAQILEVSGDAAHAILDTVKELQDQAMQAIHGSRADPAKLAISNSSLGQKTLYLPTIQLAGHLRVSFGDQGLVPLLKMMITIAAEIKVKVLGVFPKSPDPKQNITLVFGDWFPPTSFDQNQASTAFLQLVTAGIISKKTALMNLREFITIGDIDDELALIKSERDEDDQREISKTKAMQPPTAQPMNTSSK